MKVRGALCRMWLWLLVEEAVAKGWRCHIVHSKSKPDAEPIFVAAPPGDRNLSTSCFLTDGITPDNVNWLKTFEDLIEQI